MKTAVEWLAERFYANEGIMKSEWLEQAKAMEKEQIMESWKHGNLPTFLGRVLTAEEFYNETFK